MSAISDDFEKPDIDPMPWFAVLDYIPLVSIISGVARGVFGIIEILFGLFVFPFQLALRVSQPSKPFLLTEGFGDLVRGLIAVKPIVGNVILYLYDHAENTRMDIRRAAGLSHKRYTETT